MRLARRFAAPVLGLALIGAGWGSSAAAQDSPERLVLRAVDSRDSDNVQVVVSYSGDPGDLDDLTLRQNGREVDATVTPAVAANKGTNNDITFVVDSSTSTDANALLTNVEEALGAFVEDLPAGMRVSIVTAGAAAQTLQRHTIDVGRLQEAITDLTPGGEGGVLSATLQAGSRIDTLGSVGTVVLFTDGARNESVGVNLVEGGLQSGGAMLHVIGLTVDGFDEGLFSGLARNSGGSIQLTDDPEAIGDLLDSLEPELANLTVAAYPSSAERGVQDLEVEVGGVTASGSFVSGGNQIGVHRLVSRPGVEPSGPSFLRGDTGKTIGLIGVAVAGVLFAFGMISVFVRDDTALTTALRPYADRFVAEDGEEEGSDEVTQTAFLKRAVQATEDFAERQGFLSRVEHALEKADMPLRAGEAMFFYLATVVLLIGLAFALTQNPLGALVIALFGILIPPAVVNFLATRKKKAFEALLPDTLQLLASTLRAGYSMMQGVEAVSQEAAEPMGKELRRVVTEARLGRPLEESLDGIAERMGSKDFAWAVMAIRIQREVGGNLSELLMTVAETMTERERLRRDVNSLTAEGRISAYVLIALPIGLGMFLYTSNKDYIGTLFDESLGQIMLAGAILGIAVGYAWMMKIIKIEI